MITCIFENKHQASLRHVSVDAIAFKNNQILLVKRAAHLLEGNKYALPGGFLDRDETIQQAILREIKEETGFIGKNPLLFRINSNPNRKGEDRQNVDCVFIVQLSKQISRPEKREVDQIYWFNLDKLPRSEEFAFDHYESLKLYIDYQHKSIPLPIIN
jgi:8-oxo-dGTP diphosphatase